MRPAVGIAALVTSAVVGVLAGVGAHAVVPQPGTPSVPPPSTRAPSASPTSAPGTPITTFLGDNSILQIVDLSVLGWRTDDVQEATAEGDAQAPLTCQREAIGRAGAGVNAMMNGYWQHVGSDAIADESINEIVAQYGTVEQAETMSSTIQGWFAHCASLEADGGVAGPSQRIVSTTADILWWRVKVGDGKVVHEGVVRGANRVALVAAYSPPTTDAEFVALMKKAAKRLVQ